MAQMAAIEAATGPQEPMHAMIAEYKRRRDWLVPALNEISGITCDLPEGAFYAMPNVKRLLGGRVQTSAQFAQFLLEEKAVAVTDGGAFGMEGYVRISYATSLEMLQQGVQRIAEAARELSRQ